MRAGQCGGCFMSEQESVPAMLQWQCSGYWAPLFVWEMFAIMFYWVLARLALCNPGWSSHHQQNIDLHGIESKSRCGEQSTVMTGPVLPVSLIKMDLSCRSINNVGQVVVGPGSLLVKVNTGVISYNCPVCQPRPLTHQLEQVLSSSSCQARSLRPSPLGKELLGACKR